ncbi:hypothetical protein [Brevundimonas lutea]|uniref:hypothetical protein n=1 Tax=Brevundimonas lutea TaxID=2293980 RepID=UPI000F0200D8|nr:hypothetical protein [Brevundimonas lutea]
MFERGKDLLKLFARARAGEDRAWIELIDARLLEREARGRAIDGRTDNRRPSERALAVAALWREHGRRTGARLSAERAREALKPAQTSNSRRIRAHAAVEAARLVYQEVALRGGSARAAELTAALEAAETVAPGDLALTALALRAQTLAAADPELPALIDAMSALVQPLRDAGLHEDATELLLDQAATALGAGLRLADPRLLNRAGQELRALVQDSHPDHRPVTRARALLLCGVGMATLARLARDDTSARAAEEMFNAAAGQFTPDHSPLDWAAIELARPGPASGPGRLAVLTQAEALTAGEGLVLGAVARERRLAVATEMAASDAGRLLRLEGLARRRLIADQSTDAPLDWAADQIGLARLSIRTARLAGKKPAAALGLALAEASMVAREEGAPVLAERAEALLDEAFVTA